MGCGASTQTASSDAHRDASSVPGRQPSLGGAADARERRDGGASTQTASSDAHRGASPVPGRQPSLSGAADALKGRTNWGRCAWSDRSAGGDFNALVNVRDCTVGIEASIITRMDRVLCGDGDGKGLVIDLVELSRRFASSGAEGISAAAQLLQLVCVLTMGINKSLRDNTQKDGINTWSKGVAQTKKEGKVFIKEIRMRCKALSSSQRESIPLFHLDSLLSQAEILLMSIPDPDFNKSAAFAALNIGKSIVLSVATMKIEDNLLRNLCTGINMAAEARAQTNATRVFILFDALRTLKVTLLSRLHSKCHDDAPQQSLQTTTPMATANTTQIDDAVLDCARKMQALFEQDPSPQVGSFFAECLADTLIGSSDRNFTHLDKECIYFLVLGERRGDTFRGLAHSYHFKGLAGLAVTGAGDKAAGAIAANIQRLRVFIEETVRGTIFGHDDLDMSEIVTELRAIIEPEVLNALQGIVASGQELAGDFTTEAIARFERAVSDCVESKDAQRGLATAVSDIEDFIARVNSGLQFVNTVMSSLQQSVGTALVLVKNASNMLKMLLKALVMPMKISTDADAVDNFLKKSALDVKSKIATEIQSKIDSEMQALQSGQPEAEEASMAEESTLRSIADQASLPVNLFDDADTGHGGDTSPNVDARKYVLLGLVALSHVEASLESLRDMVGHAQAIQEQAGMIVSAGESLIKLLSSSPSSSPRGQAKPGMNQSDVSPHGRITELSNTLARFARSKLVAMAVSVDANSSIFGSAMTFFACSTPLDIHFLNAQPGQANGGTWTLPEKMTVQAIHDPSAGGLKYVSSCSKFEISWYVSQSNASNEPVAGWAIHCASKTEDAPSYLLSSGPRHNGLTAGEWKMHALSVTTSDEKYTIVTRRLVGMAGQIKDTMKQKVEGMLSTAKYALQDKLHDVFLQGEEWAQKQLANGGDALGMDLDEVEEHAGALSACFTPVKNLIGSVVKDVFAGQESWRTRAIAIYLLLQLKYALAQGSDVEGLAVGNLAPQARKEITKAIGKILMERRALETDPRVRKAFNTEACAADAAGFRLASWKDPKVEADKDVGDVERLELEILGTSDPDQRNQLESRKKELLDKQLNTEKFQTVMIPMLQKMQTRIIQMQMQIDSKQALSSSTDLADWKESEDDVQDHLRQRLDALTELREKMEEESDPMQKELLLMECRQKQVEIRQQFQNVQGVGQSLGIIISFLDGMQSQLTTINGKLDKISADVQRLENRVAGRPAEEQIRMVLEDSEEKSISIPDDVFIETECLRRCEHMTDDKPGGFTCPKCKEGRNQAFTESSTNKPRLLLPLVAEFLGGGKDGRGSFSFIHRHQSSEIGPESVIDDSSIGPNGRATTTDEIDGASWNLGSLLIHGPAGSGKSSFAKETTKFVLQHRHYMREVHGFIVIPIFINLPVMTNPLTELFEEGLRRQYNFRDTQIFELKEKIQDPASRMVVVLFLDGFDELKPEYRSKNLYKTNNLELLRPRFDNADSASGHFPKVISPKVITMCRSEYLSEQKDGEYQKAFLPLEASNQRKNMEDLFAEYMLTRFDKKVEAYLRRSVAISVRKKFEDVYGKFRKPSPDHVSSVKRVLVSHLKNSIDTHKKGVREETVGNDDAVLSPLQIEEIRKSVCLVLQGEGALSLETKTGQKAKDGHSIAREYDESMDDFLRAQKRETVLSRPNFSDDDKKNERYILAMLRLLRQIQRSVQRQHSLHQEDEACSMGGKTQDGESKLLWKGAITKVMQTNRVAKPVPTSEDAKKTAEEKKVIEMLAEAEVWSVPRAWHRLSKVEGLDDLKNTPFMVKLIFDILPRLNEMSASPSTVKQNLILLCSSEDLAEMTMARLQQENITTSPKDLEKFQLDLIVDEAASKNRLDKIAQDISPKTNKQTNNIDPDSFARLLFSVLRRRSLSRSIIYSVFTSMFIEAKARDKQATSSTSLTVAQLQREASLYCERLAMAMTKENMPKVEYANASLVFQDNSTNPFLEFFGRGGSEASVLEIVQTCSPLTKAQGVCSFLHKSLQEFYTALGIMQHLEVLRSSCKSDDKQLLRVLALPSMLPAGGDATSAPDVEFSEKGLMRILSASDWTSGEVSTSSSGVADRKRMSQDLIRLMGGLETSALDVLNLAQEEGVRDFLIDLLLSNPAYQTKWSLMAHFCASHVGSAFEMIRENVWTVMTMANPKRHGGSLLHVACREGNLPLLRMVFDIMRDCRCYHDRMANEDTTPFLMRGTSQFKAIPVVAAALHGHLECVNHFFQFVENVAGRHHEGASASSDAHEQTTQTTQTQQQKSAELVLREPWMSRWKDQVTSLVWSGASGYRLSDADAPMIAQALECMQGLKRLDISDNRIGADGCQFLGKKLKFATSLQVLDISKNPIGVEGCEQLVHLQEDGDEVEGKSEKGLGCAVSLQELRLHECSIGPEGSRAVAAVLHHLTALERLHLHDEIGQDVTGSIDSAGALVLEGCLLPPRDDLAGSQNICKLNLPKLHAHVPSLLKEKTVNLPETQENLERALSINYCLAKVATGVSIDLLQELSDAARTCPQSQALRELQTLVSRSLDFVRKRKGRAAAQALLQLAYQEPKKSGLPAMVEAVQWDEIAQNEGRVRRGTPASAALIAFTSAPVERPDANLLTISQHLSTVNGVKFFPCGTLLASVDGDGDVLICSAATGEVKCRLAGHNKDGRGGCTCGKAVKTMTEVDDDCPLRSTGGHAGAVYCVDVCKDGELLATGGADGTVRVWGRRNGTSIFILKSEEMGHGKPVRSVAWNHNGTKLASGSKDCTIKTWSVGSSGTLACESTLTGHRYVPSPCIECLLL